MAQRGEACSACERPSMAGEDFGGPCVHDSDLECALAQLKDARAESQRLSDEWSAALEWVRSGGPCRETAGCIYGPYLDACEIVAESLERREHLRVDTLREQLRLARERAAIAERERDEAVAMNQAMSRVLTERMKP